MGQPRLEDVDKARIRSEEIYRTEVRRELEGEGALGPWRKIARFLNSPLAIWALTSIGIGLISFLYSQRTEQHAARLSDERQAAKVFFEAQFRIDQFDEVIEKAKVHLAENHDDGSATSAMLLLFSGIGLGGVTSFPLGDEFNVWVNGSGNGNRILPAGRGFQDQDFQGHSLLNLWYSYRLLMCGKRPADREVAHLRSQLHGLKAAIQERISREEAEEILSKVDALWALTKDQFTMFAEPGPRFDGLDYCEPAGIRGGGSR